MRRFWEWLIAPVMPTFSLEEVERVRLESYNMGLVQGELMGRQALSEEIQQMFPPDHAMSAVDAAKVKSRQVH
jgi:hypothetical protein